MGSGDDQATSDREPHHDEGSHVHAEEPLDADGDRSGLVHQELTVVRSIVDRTAAEEVTVRSVVDNTAAEEVAVLPHLSFTSCSVAVSVDSDATVLIDIFAAVSVDSHAGQSCSCVSRFAHSYAT